MRAGNKERERGESLARHMAEQSSKVRRPWQSLWGRMKAGDVTVGEDVGWTVIHK